MSRLKFFETDINFSKTDKYCEVNKCLVYLYYFIHSYSIIQTLYKPCDMVVYTNSFYK